MHTAKSTTHIAPSQILKTSFLSLERHACYSVSHPTVHQQSFFGLGFSLGELMEPSKNGKFIDVYCPVSINNLRLGTKKGFANIKKAQCHCVATAMMNHCAKSLLENVVGYDPSHLDQHCNHELALSQNPAIYLRLVLKFSDFSACLIQMLLFFFTTPPSDFLQLSQPALPFELQLSQPALPRLTPQMFGSPTSRPREYRLTWDEGRCSWTHDSQM